MENKKYQAFILSLFFLSFCVYSKSIAVDDFKSLWNHYRVKASKNITWNEGEIKKIAGNPVVERNHNFWDTSPRSFFLSLTGSLAHLEKSVYADIETGKELDLRPLLGYRFLPLRPSDLLPRQGNVYPVKLRVKIFLPHSRDLIKKFDIKNTTDNWNEEDEEQKDYYERRLQFTLFFDAPVILDSSSRRITKAGRIMGEGLWEHQKNGEKGNHPDFLAFITMKEEEKARGKRELFVLEMKNLFRLYPKLSQYSDNDIHKDFLKLKFTQLLKRRGIKEVIKLEEIDLKEKQFVLRGQIDEAYKDFFRKTLKENAWDVSLNFKAGETN